MIVVLGATGQVGSEIMKMLYSSDSFKGTLIMPLSSKAADLSIGFVADAIVKSVINPQASLIINCSSCNDVDGMQNDLKVRERGYGLNHALLGKIVEHATCPIIHISTDYVFDSGNKTDEDEPHPLCEYGHSKRLGEIEVLKSDQGYVFRTSSVYSKMPQNFVYKFINSYLKTDLAKTCLLPPQISSPNSAKFVANGILLAAKAILNNEMPKRRVYHLTTTGAVSRIDFAKFIKTTVAPANQLLFFEKTETDYFRPTVSNLILSEDLKRIGVQETSWQDDFMSYFMPDIFKIRTGASND